MQTRNRWPRAARLAAWAGRLAGALAAGYLGYLSVEGSRRLIHPETRAFEPEDGLPRDPGDLGLAFEEVRIGTDDGVSLAGWFIPAGRDTRAAVVVLHGFTGHRLAELGAFVPWLQPQYNVLQFDFRGHGSSGPAAVTLGARERRDVAAAVSYLAARGLGPVALFGISMGAAIAIVAAPELPVVAVVADAAYADLHHPIRNMLRRERYPLARLGSRLIVTAGGLRAGERLVSPIQRVGRIAPRALLLIASRADWLIDYTQSVRLYGAAAQPKELYIVDQADHASARWVGGPEYERRVLDFLARHLDETATSHAA